MNDLYKLVFSQEKLRQTENNSSFFQNYIILTFLNNIANKFNNSFLIILSKQIYIYNFINSVNINKDKTDFISQKS